MLKQFTTNHLVNYTIILENGLPNRIIVEGTKQQVYYFNPIDGQMVVTDTLFKQTIKSILQNNISDFITFNECIGNKYYSAMANEVFKEYWNELYSLAVEISFSKDTI